MNQFDWKLPLTTNISKLRFLGLWPEGGGGYKFKIYTLWTIFSFCVLNFGQNFFQTINVIFIFDDLEAIVENIVVTLSELLGLLKAYCVIRKMKNLKQLVAKTNNRLFQPKNKRQMKMIQSGITIWYANYVAYWMITLSAAFFLSTYPILDKSYKHYRLPYMAWYPFNTKESPFYEITFAYQFLGVIFIAATAVSVDTLITGLDVCITAQFHILNDDIKSIFDEKKPIGNIYEHKFLNCVSHHREIIK